MVALNILGIKCKHFFSKFGRFTATNISEGRVSHSFNADLVSKSCNLVVENAMISHFQQQQKYH